MSDQIYSSDNSGNRVPCHPNAADPVDFLTSGQTLTHATADTNGTVTVVAGAIYALTAQKTGGIYAGILTTGTAANIMWACPLYQTIIIRIPGTNTSLHFAPDTNNAVGYLRRIR